MKTVTAKITSSEPVTVAMAASILSKFLKADNGASQAVKAYLRRASAASAELARLHSDGSAVAAATTDEVTARSGGMSQEPSYDTGGTEKLKKKKKKKKVGDEGKGESDSGSGRGRVEIGGMRNEMKKELSQGEPMVGYGIERKMNDDRLGEESQGKKKKKNKERTGEIGDSGNRVNEVKVETNVKEEQSNLAEERERTKHRNEKKKEMNHVEEIGVAVETKGQVQDGGNTGKGEETEGKKKKKRKKREVDDEDRDGSEQRLSKKDRRS